VDNFFARVEKNIRLWINCAFFTLFSTFFERLIHFFSVRTYLSTIFYVYFFINKVVCGEVIHRKPGVFGVYTHSKARFSTTALFSRAGFIHILEKMMVDNPFLSTF